MTAKLAVSLHERALETVQKAEQLRNILWKEGGEGTASVLWPTTAGLYELIAELEVVKGLVTKLKRMNLEMHERLRSKVDLLTSDASA